MKRLTTGWSIGIASLFAMIPNAHAENIHQTHQFNYQQDAAVSVSGHTTVLAQETPAPSIQPPVDLTAETASDDAETVYLPGPVRTIVIDPGHGGTNEGAIGIAGIHEKVLTLQMALLLADRLRTAMPGTEVILTRQRDVSMSLSERIEIANKIGADLFISLHYNSSGNPDAIGFESFWAGDYWEKDLEKAGVEIDAQMRSDRTRTAKLGERMAKCFNRSMRHFFDVLDRGVKPGDYTVLTRAEVPAVVLEMAFISHAQEGLDAIKPQTRGKLLNALVQAVLRYASDEIL